MESLFLTDVQAITDRIFKRYLGGQGAAGWKAYSNLRVEEPSGDRAQAALDQPPPLWQMVGDKTQELKRSQP